MKKEYDFSKGERGKFHRPNIELSLPVYLDPDVTDVLRKVAAEKGTDIATLANDWIRAQIALFETAAK